MKGYLRKKFKNALKDKRWSSENFNKNFTQENYELQRISRNVTTKQRRAAITTYCKKFSDNTVVVLKVRDLVSPVAMAAVWMLHGDWPVVWKLAGSRALLFGLDVFFFWERKERSLYLGQVLWRSNLWIIIVYLFQVSRKNLWIITVHFFQVSEWGTAVEFCEDKLRMKVRKLLNIQVEFVGIIAS